MKIQRDFDSAIIFPYTSVIVRDETFQCRMGLTIVKLEYGENTHVPLWGKNRIKIKGHPMGNKGPPVKEGTPDMVGNSSDSGPECGSS